MTARTATRGGNTTAITPVRPCSGAVTTTAGLRRSIMSRCLRCEEVTTVSDYEEDTLRDAERELATFVDIAVEQEDVHAEVKFQAAVDALRHYRECQGDSDE